MYGDYLSFSKNDAVVAGMTKNQGGPDVWTTICPARMPKPPPPWPPAARSCLLSGSFRAIETMTILADPGGTVLGPAEDTRYGRRAEATDPTGASLTSTVATTAD